MKCRRRRNQSKPKDTNMAEVEEKVVNYPRKERSKIKAKTHYNSQLSSSDSHPSNSISEEFLDEAQQRQVTLNSELLDQGSNDSTQSTSTTENRTLTKPVNVTLDNTGKRSQASSEDTTNGTSNSAVADDNSKLSTPDGPLILADKPNVMESSTTRIASSMESLKIIFPSTSQTKYDPMFLLEKIAFIYIELVIKRGYKAMTNRPFRNLA
ncbi:unnamed protein product, partial [Rotaria sp. Silwood2]